MIASAIATLRSGTIASGHILSRGWLVVVLLVQLAAGAVITLSIGPDADTWRHMPSGLNTWASGNFRSYNVNPPLVRLISSLPVHLFGGNIEWPQFVDRPGVRTETAVGDYYLMTVREQAWQWYRLSQLTALAFALLGTVLIDSIARRLWGPFSAAIAATLWATSPIVLAFSPSLAADVASATMLLLTCWRFYVWLRLRDFKSAGWLGTALGLSLATKFTLLALPVGLMVSYVIALVSDRRRLDLRQEMLQMLFGGIICLLLVNAMYLFDGTLLAAREYDFVSEAFERLVERPIQASEDASNSIVGLLRRIPIPLPKEYLIGIDVQRRDFEGRWPSYLLGQWSDDGWWYYYLVGFVVKEPLGFWGILAVGAMSLLAVKRVRFRRYAVLTAPAWITLIFISTQTGMNHHLRYALPFYPAAYLLAGLLCCRLSMLGKYSVAFLLLCYAGSSLSHLPFSYCYFNRLVGGVENGSRIIGHSSLSYGQDLPQVIEWCEKQDDDIPVYFFGEIHIAASFLGLRANNLWHPERPTQECWFLISAAKRIEPGYDWLDEFQITECVSPTTYAYHFVSRGDGTFVSVGGTK